nr:unnamed protein product [Digitaria exilis]
MLRRTSVRASVIWSSGRLPSSAPQPSQAPVRIPSVARAPTTPSASPVLWSPYVCGSVRLLQRCRALVALCSHLCPTDSCYRIWRSK